MPLSKSDLAGIRERAERAKQSEPDNDAGILAQVDSAQDVPVLLTEVERLQTKLRLLKNTFRVIDGIRGSAKSMEELAMDIINNTVKGGEEAGMAHLQGFIDTVVRGDEGDWDIDEGESDSDTV